MKGGVQFGGACWRSHAARSAHWPGWWGPPRRASCAPDYSAGGGPYSRRARRPPGQAGRPPYPGPLHRLRRTRAGFTLVEVLAALLFLAIAIPAILGAISASSRAGGGGGAHGHRGAIGGKPAQPGHRRSVEHHRWKLGRELRGSRRFRHGLSRLPLGDETGAVDHRGRPDPIHRAGLLLREGRGAARGNQHPRRPPPPAAQ